MFQTHNLNDIYSSETDIIRVKNYIKAFQEKFQTDSFLIVRSPGRVNLIGEHIDYSHLPVLPAAIEKDIYIILSPSDDNQVHISSYLGSYPDEIFSLERHIPAFAQGHWGNYVKAGLQTMIDYFNQSHKGFKALIAGNIPAGSGLSSSSALVVASAAAYLTANHLEMDKLVFAEKLAEGEKYVGTAGGGMDQAASVFGAENSAIKINFAPLEIENIPVPEDYHIVIAHSLTVAEKSKGALIEYNSRSLETRIVTALLSSHLVKTYGSEYAIDFIGDLRQESFSSVRKNLSGIADELFHNLETVTGPQAAKLLNMQGKDLTAFFTLKNGSVFPYQTYTFKLKKRIQHIISEWKRVEKSTKALSENNIAVFGQLMNESHQSCRDNYEVSREELDTLAEIERKAGAVGARLTGAGFGGSTVCLVKKEDSQKLIQTVIEQYYQQYLSAKHPDAVKSVKNFEDIIFQTKATEGTCLVDSSL